MKSRYKFRRHRLILDSGHSSLLLSEPNEHMLERSGSFRRSFRSLQPSASLRNELHLAAPSPCPSQIFNHFQPIIKLNSDVSSFRALDDWEPTGPADRTFKIIFAGDSAVGKSSFISRLHDGVFISHTTTTLGNIRNMGCGRLIPVTTRLRLPLTV